MDRCPRRCNVDATTIISMTMYVTLQLYLIATAFGTLTGFSIAALVYALKM